MSYATFTFNVDSAKKADNEAGRITETGKYIGTILSAEFVTSQKGSKGIEFSFETDDKQTARFTIWTNSADGNPIFGTDKVNAILACTRTRQLTPTDAILKKYDFDEKKEIEKSCIVAPELAGKKIGLLLQKEEYYNANSDVKSRIQFVASFCAETELMAKEICEKKTVAELLPKAYDRLIKAGDKTVEPAYKQTSSGGYGANPAYSTAVDDSDILPF